MAGGQPPAPGPADEASAPAPGLPGSPSTRTIPGMNARKYRRSGLIPILTIILAAPGGAGIAGPGADRDAPPAKVAVEVAPSGAGAGETVEVTLQLSPRSGIKINRYPKISLRVAEVPGLVQAGEAAVGNDKAPPPDRLDDNYFKTVDPVRLTLTLDPAAPSGHHEIAAKLKYYYCVAASGYCAPKKEEIRIPIDVR